MQRRFTRKVPEMRDFSDVERLEKMELISLEQKGSGEILQRSSAP